MSLWEALGLSDSKQKADQQRTNTALGNIQSNMAGLDQRAAGAESTYDTRSQNAVNRNGPQADWGQAQGDYGQQQKNIADQNSLAAMMNERAQGKGLSAAQLQMQAGQAQAAANAQAAAAGARGGGLAQVLAARGAAEQNAGAQQAAVGQGAALRANEMTAAQNSLAGLYGQQAQAEAAMRAGSQAQSQYDVTNAQQNYAQQQQAAQGWAGLSQGALGQQYGSQATVQSGELGLASSNQQADQSSLARSDKYIGAGVSTAGSVASSGATSDERAKTGIVDLNSPDASTQMDMLYEGLDPDPQFEGKTFKDREGQGAIETDDGGLRRATYATPNDSLAATLAGYGGQATRDKTYDQTRAQDFATMGAPAPDSWVDHTADDPNAKPLAAKASVGDFDPTSKTGLRENADDKQQAAYTASDPNKAAFDQLMASGSKGGSNPFGDGQRINHLAAFGTAFASDERCKKNVQALGDNPITDMLREAPPKAFRYKDPADGEGPRIGVMAQDLAKTPAGRTMVRQEPTGKLVLDPQASLSAVLASNAQLQREIDALRGKKGGK